jgi:prephenate dehydratase
MHQVDLYKSEAEAAYQGAPGAYSEQAAQALLGTDARLMPCATLEQTFEAVGDGRANHAVVPVENAISGTVPLVYELLLEHDLAVSGETVINIDYVLVAPPGTKRRDVSRVLSHPIALAQCADFFRQNRGIEAVSVFDTAGAVRMIVQAGEASTAAIASRRAAGLYGAEILAEHIQDHPGNWTRFLLLSNRQHAERIERPQKILVAFGLRHEPGALVEALQPLASHGLSVTKIEGRPASHPQGAPFEPRAFTPAHGQPFDYRFVVEAIAAEGDTIPAQLQDDLRGATTWFKLLGAYRV